MDQKDASPYVECVVAIVRQQERVLDPGVQSVSGVADLGFEPDTNVNLWIVRHMIKDATQVTAVFL